MSGLLRESAERDKGMSALTRVSIYVVCGAILESWRAFAPREAPPQPARLAESGRVAELWLRWQRCPLQGHSMICAILNRRLHRLQAYSRLPTNDRRSCMAARVHSGESWSWLLCST